MSTCFVSGRGKNCRPHSLEMPRPGTAGLGMTGVPFDVSVIERNVRRLRSRLARAWDQGRSPAIIRRLENELRLWWRRREAARRANVTLNT